jgi:hypothetical protein
MVKTIPTCPTLAPGPMRFNNILLKAIFPAMFARTMANTNQRRLTLRMILDLPTTGVII